MGIAGMLYEKQGTEDLAHHGRMLLLGIGVAFLIAWSYQFLSSSVILVPGFLYDSTPRALMILLGLVLEFVFFAVGFLLLWGGVGWMRYPTAIGYFVLGIGHLVYSITLDTAGGAELLVAAVLLASAGCLVLSSSLDRFLRERKQREVPWLSLGLWMGVMAAVMAAVVCLQLLQSYLLLRADQQEFAFAAKVVQQFAPTVNSSALTEVADEPTRQTVQSTDYQYECDEARAELGAFQSVVRPSPPSYQEIVMDPDSHESLAYVTTASYAKGSMTIALTIEVSHQPWKVTSAAFSWSLKRPKRAK